MTENHRPTVHFPSALQSFFNLCLVLWQNSLQPFIQPQLEATKSSDENTVQLPDEHQTIDRQS